MQQLIAKHCSRLNANQKPKIIVTSFKNSLYDVAKFRSEHTQYPTIYEMIKIDDHIVANTLIDQRRVEAILLIPDFESGKNIIEHHSNQNCSEAYLLNGDNLKGHPSFRHYACHHSVKPKYFIENTQDIIEGNTEDIRQLGEEVFELKRNLKDIDCQIKENDKLKKSNESHLLALGRESIKLNSQLRDARNIEIKEPINMQMYEVEIEKLNEEIRAIEQSIVEIEESSSEKKTQYAQVRLERENIEIEMKKFLDEIASLKECFAHFEAKSSELAQDLDHQKKQMADHLEKERVCIVTFEQISEDLDKFKALAIEICPDRIDTKRLPQAIKDESEGVTKQIDETKKLNGDEKMICLDYKTKWEKFKMIKNDIKKQKKFLENLRCNVERRNEAIHHMRCSKALYCSLTFTNLVHSRNFTGRLIFNHDKKTLNVIFEPSGQKNGQCTVNDLKSLSGGERSFSTVAFLLSLWSIVESPVLFLDEFDVFMDQLNRTFSLELIVDQAKKQPNSQFTFLTPQETMIKTDKYVKVFKMPDPVREIDLNNNYL